MRALPGTRSWSLTLVVPVLGMATKMVLFSKLTASLKLNVETLGTGFDPGFLGNISKIVFKIIFNGRVQRQQEHSEAG